MSERIGILGGTFDPIHVGHLDLAAAAAARLQLTSLLVLPSHVPPHRPPPAASAYHRFAMTAMAVAGRAGWTASDLEIRESSYSYTADTLRRLHQQGLRAEQLYFLTGADAFAGIRNWKDYPALLGLAHFVVVSRPGFSIDNVRPLAEALGSRHHGEGGRPSITVIEAPTTDVSSTTIRGRLAAGHSIQGMVVDGVRQHIEQHGLYGSVSAIRRGQESLEIPAAGRLHGQD
jgi:nicotinate-nucleotide adenylyltransferase